MNGSITLPPLAWRARFPLESFTLLLGFADLPGSRLEESSYVKRLSESLMRFTPSISRNAIAFKRLILRAPRVVKNSTVVKHPNGRICCELNTF